MTKVDYLKQPTHAILKARFREVQTRLRQTKLIKIRDFQAFVIEKEPQFNCPEGWEKIRNTWNRNGMNIRVCELLNEYENHLNEVK